MDERAAQAVGDAKVMLRGANERSPGVRGETVCRAMTVRTQSILHSGAGASTLVRCGPLSQVSAETAARAVCVASRTKRTTVRTEVRMSAKQAALALLARPNQGERLTPCRAWSALRLLA